jgi:hypothetical protein
VRTIFGSSKWMISKTDQTYEAGRSPKPNRTAVSTITTVGSSFIDERLTTKGNCTRTTVSSAGVKLCSIYKLGQTLPYQTAGSAQPGRN